MCPFPKAPSEASSSATQYKSGVPLTSDTNQVCPTKASGILSVIFCKSGDVTQSSVMIEPMNFNGEFGSVYESDLGRFATRRRTRNRIDSTRNFMTREPEDVIMLRGKRFIRRKYFALEKQKINRQKNRRKANRTKSNPIPSLF